MSELIEYKCPCCGGAREFSSTEQKMKCSYCGTSFDMVTLKKYDAQLKMDQTEEMSWESNPGQQWQDGETVGMRLYVCQSCGGEIVADESTAASSCPYCDNPIVIKGQFAGDLKPDLVIPFKLDKQAAKRGFLNHLQGKRLLPKEFKDENHINEIKGVYVPVWLFDTDADADIRYRATKIRRWSDSNYNYTETKYYSVTRAGKIGFEKVPVDGSSKMGDALMESIEPFDVREAVDFQTAYLAGYLADKYDVSADESKHRANERVRNTTEQNFARTVKGYASVTPEHTSIRLYNSKAKYALYPVWILNTTWQDKLYTFAMNGQTGKFVGDLPLDKKTYRKWLWGLTAAICGGLYILKFIAFFV